MVSIVAVRQLFPAADCSRRISTAGSWLTCASPPNVVAVAGNPGSLPAVLMMSCAEDVGTRGEAMRTCHPHELPRLELRMSSPATRAAVSVVAFGEASQGVVAVVGELQRLMRAGSSDHLPQDLER